MNDLLSLQKEIESEIYKKIRELKTELFENSGTTLDRNWHELSPKYKKFKQKIRGSAYPINIFSGYLLQGLIDDAISIKISHDEELDIMSFSVNLNTDKIGLKYAEFVNDQREYISLSDEEKQIINELVIEIVESYFEAM